jgi:protein RecA
MGFIDDIFDKIGENDLNQDVSDWLGTGFLPLNKALSGRHDGGFPVGRITEIYGGESSGKTLLATMAMIETQRKGGLAVMLDYEHAFSMRRARSLGLCGDRETWIYKQPETAEAGFKIIELIANKVREADSEKHVTVVCDSVASMLTQSELEADYDESNMKTKLSLPAVLSTSLKKLAGLINKTNVTLIFLNQVRDNPGVMFGDKEKTAGGRALKFYASVRVRLSKAGKIKEGEDITGENVVALTVKNKVFEPFKKVVYVSNFAEGVNLELSHINALKNAGMLGSTKGWLVWDGEKFRAKDLEALLKKERLVEGGAYERFLSLFDELDGAK